MKLIKYKIKNVIYTYRGFKSENKMLMELANLKKHYPDVKFWLE